MPLESLRSVDTVANLKALTEDDNTIIFVRGYYAIADGGGGHYILDTRSTEPDNRGTIITPDAGPGRWKLIHDGILSVEQFGASSTQTAATNTLAIQNAAAVSPRTLYLRNVTYPVFPSITGSAQVLFDLTNENGVTVDGRGAELKIVGTFRDDERVTMFLMDGASKIVIRNLTLSGPEETNAKRHIRGMFAFWHRNGAENIIIQNIRQTSGKIGVGCHRNALTEPLTNTCRRLIIDNYEAIGVAYPLSFQHSGDNVEVRNFRTIRCTRAYFPYGVRDHNVSVTVSDPSTSPMIDLTAQTRTAESAFLENINCSVTVIDEDANIESTWCGLVIQTFPGQIHPATIRNIRLDINGTMTKKNKAIFTIEKQFDGSPDILDRGHVIQDVELSGNVTYKVNASASPIRAMVSPHQGQWGTGETVRALRLRNLCITHPGFSKPPTCKIGVNSLSDLLVLENCDIPNGLKMPGELRRGTRCINTRIASSFYVDTINSTQSLTGNGSRGTIDLDHLLTEIRTSAPTSFTLANGQEGQEKQLILAATNGPARVKPRKLRGYRTITFNRVGDAAVLKFSNGTWTILSNQGCTLA